MEYTLPDRALIALVGMSGAGKSTFARRHFAPTQVLSSDFFRGMVADDESDQTASADAFDTLYYLANKRLAAGRLTVIDATNVRPADRARIVRLAKAHDVAAVAIVLDVPEPVCLARNASRPDHRLDPDTIRKQGADLRRAVGGLATEGFRTVHVLSGTECVDAAVIRITPLRNDLRAETGPFDVIGDVHGCRTELELLLDKLGYALDRDPGDRPVGAAHPNGRRAVFVGDLVDRGPDTAGVLRLVMAMVADGSALVVRGNHEQRLIRVLNNGRGASTHGLAQTQAQLAAETAEFRAQVARFCADLTGHYLLDGGSLVVAHAGLAERYHGKESGRTLNLALYGDTTGERDDDGYPVRRDWAADYRGSAMVLYGHIAQPRHAWVNNTLCLDTGCVFGGELTALRYPERELVSVPAGQVYYEPSPAFR